jgi:hypothetical protein
MEKWTDDFGSTLWVHDKTRCNGEPCPIHNPTDHTMKDFKRLWRHDWGGFMERICPHGVGHPDPDCIRAAEAGLGHGCDGCCRSKND